MANRVSEILLKIDSTHWAHVVISQNPTDLAFRGLKLSELVKADLWLKAPVRLWSEKIAYKWPKATSTTVEQRPTKVHVGISPEVT